ncbi:MAG: YicC/YloC family endoribonuclease [Bauldia sp.]
MATPVQSMTGFARADGAAYGTRWTWELRSVNGKGLEVRYRGPAGSERLEPVLRERLQAAFARGSIQANLVQHREGGASLIKVNREALVELVDAIRSIDPSANPALESLLSVRGVVEVVEEEPEAPPQLAAAIASDLDLAVTALAAARINEGAAIAAILLARLDQIEALADAADRHPARTPEAIRARLAEQIATLSGAANGLDQDRLHQEAMLLATRADIREEIDRLNAHVAAARELLKAGGPIGRRLDFLAQEFNRETNTLCSKAIDKGVTAIGLDLKVAVDQFREQIQNLE